MKDVMYVTSSNGLPVNLRKTASKSAEIIKRIPVGSIVNVIGERDDGWTYVSYADKKGYIMTMFLTQGSSPPKETDEGGVLWQMVQSIREAIERGEKDLADAKTAVTALEELAKNE